MKHLPEMKSVDYLVLKICEVRNKTEQQKMPVLLEIPTWFVAYLSRDLKANGSKEFFTYKTFCDIRFVENKLTAKLIIHPALGMVPLVFDPQEAGFYPVVS